MKKQIFIGIALVLALALVFTGCSQTAASGSAPANSAAPAASASASTAAASQASGNKPAKIVIGYQAIPNDESIALAQKWYETELGVPVELKSFDSGRDVNTAFASGSLDIGLIGSAPVSVGISSGIPYEVFWIHDVIGSAESLAVKNSSGVTDVKGLKGKKIATPFASTSHYSLLNAIKLAGLSASDVTLLDMQPQDILAAWQRGDIDAAYVWQPTLGKLLADGKVITDSAALAKQGIVTADLGVVSKAFAQKYPDIVNKYIALQDKAVQLYRTSPNDAADAIAKQLNIASKDALDQAGQLIWLNAAEQTGSAYLGTSAAKGDLAATIKSTADFLVEQKSIEKAASLDDIKNAIAPQFAEAAAKAAPAASASK
jgi:taurine transport system substrate-binding protein